jgi:hypothetical protein
MSPEIIRLAASLTEGQRTFANEVAAGAKLSDAYRKAYNTKANPKILCSKASHARTHPKIAAYIEALIAQQEKTRFLTRESKRQRLAKIVADGKARNGDVIRAIEVDNVMTGDNAPQQVEVFGLGELLALVRKGKK